MTDIKCFFFSLVDVGIVLEAKQKYVNAFLLALAEETRMLF